MIKVLHTNDWHFAVKNPASRVDDYNEELFASLENILTLATHLQVMAICISGDLFHDRDRCPWSVLIRLLKWGERARKVCSVFTIPGNHDQKHDRFESADRTPYGALIESGIFTDVSRREVGIGSGTTLQVYGIPWPDGETPDAYKRVPRGGHIVMAHGWATPDGAERYGCYCNKHDDLAVWAPHTQLWHFGHDHSDNGVYRLKNNGWVVNIGALSRGSMDYDNLTRQVKVAVSSWSHQGALGWQCMDVQQIAMPVPPIEKIFDLKARQQRVNEQRALAQFVEQFTTSLGAGTISVRYEDVLAQIPLDAAVRTKVQQYIQAAETA